MCRRARLGRIRFELLLTAFFAIPLSAATWHIRQDGGTAAECTGKADAPYPGKGSKRPCALKNPFYLWTNDPPRSVSEKPVWKIAGGDTVVIRNGDYQMGYKTPDPNGWWNYLGCRGNNRACSNPPIPPGTAANPTRIVGEEWQKGCRVKPVLRGAGAVGAVLNLQNTSFVTVECLDITDGAQCRLATFKGEPYGCVQYRDNYAILGLQTNENSKSITLRNLFIHGMAGAGIAGAVGGDVLVENGHLRANGNFGWNFDQGGQKPSAGPLTIRKSIVEWSACVERLPLADPVILACYDQEGANANGDGLGFVDVTGDVTIDQAIVRYNQQDGLDALYIKSAKSVTVTNSQFYGNSGQQIKTGGAANTVVRNNLIVGNCDRQREAVPGVTAPDFNVHQKSWCRGSDMVALVFQRNAAVAFENNTLTGYSPTGFNIQCRSVTDVFNGAGRAGWDGSFQPSIGLDGSRRGFQTISPINHIGMTGAVWVYPQKGPRIPKRVGKAGARSCAGAPCQLWYEPETQSLWQDAADAPLQPSDQLRVEYYSSSTCDGASLSFRNNVTRGYRRIASGQDAGGFWMYNLKDGLFPDSSWSNNWYCGMRSIPSRGSETSLRSCPGTFFANEPAALRSESDLDELDPYPGPGSPMERGAGGAPSSYGHRPLKPNRER